MAKKSITTQILETAVDIEGDEQRLNALMGATNNLSPEDAAVILDTLHEPVNALPAVKKVGWLARLHQAEARISKLIKEANNG